MSKKNTNLTSVPTTLSYAEEGLDMINAETGEAEAAVNANNGANGSSEEEFTQVAGLEPVAAFYRFTAPKKESKSPYRIFEKGQTLIGTYQRAFTGGKFNNTTFIFRLADSGELIGVPGVGSLAKAMSRVPVGAKVKLTYNGMSAIKAGKWEGSDAHTFTVFASKVNPAV